MEGSAKGQERPAAKPLVVFLSYSRRDEGVVKKVMRLGRAFGVVPWRDDDHIPPGHVWRLEIAQAVEQCQRVLVFWCRHSSDSDEVRREYSRGLASDKLVVPVLIALVVDGKSILVKATDDKHLVDATRGGQMVISFAVAPIANALRGKVTELQAQRRIDVRVAGRRYTAVLTPDLAAGGYSVDVPALPGVHTEGDTLSEARKMAADAIRLWLSVARQAPQRRSK